MATPTIFISYRREDSAGQSGRIFDRLVQQFGKGHVYRDIDTITAGEDFVETVREKINQSDILLALIGPKWLTATDEEGRWRLADENDLVRIEIATALDRNMRVIPVLLQGAAIPKIKDLPGQLARLAQRNAVEIRDTNFDLDTEQLIAKIGSSWRNKFIRTFTRWPVYAVIVLLLASPLGFWIYPQVVLTPEKARIQIVQMGMQYNADTFVESAKRGDIQVIELFLRAGMDPNVKNREGYGYRQSAAMWAAAQGHLDLVKLLKAKGANLDEAISWAIGHEQKQILDFMLESNPGQNAINLGFLAAAGKKGAIDIAQTLLDRGADINFIDKETGDSALIRAIDSQYPDIKMARFLLSNGVADINLKNRTGRTALFGAVGNLDIELVELLLAYGADVNVKENDGSTPLRSALLSYLSSSVEVEQRRQEVMQMLLDNGADPTVIAKNTSWPTALSLAISNDQTQIALLLIERGAAANDQTGRSEVGLGRNGSVLMLAAEHGMPDVVKALLVKGAEINAHNEVGLSPLLSAAAGPRGNEIIPILLDSGADAGWTDESGRNVLMRVNWKSGSLREEIFKRLVKSGVKVNAVDKNGWTALMHAANSFNENPDFIQQLLRFGADTTMKNDVGDTALAIATKHDAKKTIHLLETHATNQRKNKKK